MMALDIGKEAQQAITLIKSFSLELDEYGPESQVLYWLNQYRAAWIREAIIEAIYQGRYKIISVQHILTIWQRRGQPIRHFSSGFEQVMTTQLGEPLTLSTAIAPQTGRPLSTSNDHISNGQDNHPWPRPTAPSPAVSKIMAESSVISRTGDSDLSIEAFPVEAVDTLVAVYQANGSGLGAKQVMARQVNPPRFAGLRFELPSMEGDSLSPYPDYAPGAASVPIQPFRPRPRKRYA